ncbi:MAG TPA: hypothetical protein VD908_05410 [Cytophagales bacterium]|nr:hypothetical protein [Cytophagales bacterium]
MVKVDSIVDNIAEELGGSSTPYDGNRSVLIIPIGPHRFQRVMCSIGYKDDNKVLYLESKVCEFNKGLNFKGLLMQNAELCSAKFLIKNNYVLVGASAILDSLSKEQMKHMVLEVAHAADKWEYELTGVDIN